MRRSNIRRRNVVTSAIALAGLGIGVVAPVVFGARVSSALSVFFNQSINGTIRCGKQQAEISIDTSSTPVSAWGLTKAYSNGCTNANVRLPGHLGNYVYRINSLGVVCSASGWSYNSTNSDFVASISYFPGSCSNSSGHYAQAKGRIWRGDTGAYYTSTFWSISPVLYP